MATQGISKLGTPDLGTGLWSFSPQQYSPELTAYLKQIDDLAASRSAGIGGYYNSLLPTGEYNNGDVTIPVYATEAAFAPYINKPPEENLGYQFDVGGKWGSTGQVSAGAGTNIVLVNDKTGETINAGTGFAAAEAAAQAAKDMGSKAPWSIYAAPEGTGDYYRWGQNEPQQGFVSGLGQLISTVGPVVAAGAGAGLSSLAKAGVAAGISGAGNALQGKSIADILKAAGLAAAGSYVGGKVTDAIMPSSPTAPVGGGISGAADLPYNVSPSLGGLGSITSAFDPYEISVLGNTGAGIGGGWGALGGSFGGDALWGNAAGDSLDPNEAVVTGRPTSPFNPLYPGLAGVAGIGALGALGGAGGGAGAGTATTTLDPAYDPAGDITVTAPTTGPTGPIGAIPGISTPILTTVPPFGVQTPNVTPPQNGILDSGVTVGEIPGLITGLTGLIGGIGNLIGGGDDDKDSGPLDGGGTVDIPKAIAAGKRTAITPTYDPFTYGQAGSGQPGEFGFYQGYAEGGEVDQHAAAFSQGIGHRGPGPVQGIGSGQSDEIPAWLANDEYVWSAQDVADLGDGSSTEGHRRLDKMRQDVRRRAGRKDVKNIAKPQKSNGELLAAVGAA